MKNAIAITSPKNERVKDLLRLEKARERREQGLFAAEGAREIERALRSGYEPVRMFYCADVLSPEARQLVDGVLRNDQFHDVELYDVNRPVFDKIAVREGSDGLVTVFRVIGRELASLVLSERPLILATEDVEKPGNLGALLRSADGAGCEAVIVLGGTVDPYNPNVVRTSLGTVFSVPTIAATNEEFRAFCRARGITVFGAALSERSKPHHTADYRRNAAILLGSEAHGLSSYWMKHADELVQIPMLGIADSLNVSVAGAVLLYEARRQRMP